MTAGPSAAATLDLSQRGRQGGRGRPRRGHRARRIGPATLRVHVVILSDEHGRPLTAAGRGCAARIDRADAVLTGSAGIRVRLTGVQVNAEPAPPHALDPRANRRLLLDDVLGRTEFYRRHVRPGRPAAGGASARPITVIVVRNIAGRVTGCSLGISADWVIVQASLFDPDQPRTLRRHRAGARTGPRAEPAAPPGPATT